MTDGDNTLYHENVSESITGVQNSPGDNDPVFTVCMCYITMQCQRNILTITICFRVCLETVARW